MSLNRGARRGGPRHGFALAGATVVVAEDAAERDVRLARRSRPMSASAVDPGCRRSLSAPFGGAATSAAVVMP